MKHPSFQLWVTAQATAFILFMLFSFFSLTRLRALMDPGMLQISGPSGNKMCWEFLGSSREHAVLHIDIKESRRYRVLGKKKKKKTNKTSPVRNLQVKLQGRQIHRKMGDILTFLVNIFPIKNTQQTWKLQLFFVCLFVF